MLLLGAGFTANFGAPVTQQIWNYLFNKRQIQSSKIARNILIKYRNKSDFERFYQKILDLKDMNLKKIITGEVENIYKNIDKIAQLNIENYGINVLALCRFIEKFSIINNGTGFICGLNQDLFLEWLMNQYNPSEKSLLDDRQIKYYGPIDVPRFVNNWHSRMLPSEKIFEKTTRMPTQNEIDSWDSSKFLNDNQKHPFYMKLHGSFGWFRNEGGNAPVIGGKKISKIYQEPLLMFYQKTFEKILRAEKLDIWIIGYSFSDDHINKLLEKAMSKNQSSLYIINIQPLNNLFDKLLTQSPSLYKSLNRNLRGYYIAKLAEIFPIEKSFRSTVFDQIESALAGTVI